MATNTKYDPPHTNDFEKTKLNKDATSVSGTIPAGTTANIDLLLTDDILLSGGNTHLLVYNGVRGDTWSIQIVHPIAGVIFQPTTDWYIDWSTAKQHPPKSNFPAKVFAGLTMRLVYNSTGESDVWVAVNIDKDKVLV